MGLAAFNRMRRLQAEKEAKLAQEKENDVNVPEEQKEPETGENEAQNIDEMDIEEVKKRLEELEVKFAHNTGEAKLREKLKDAIG